MAVFKSYLVKPAELHSVLSSPPPTEDTRVIPLCTSWFLPNDLQKRTGRQVYEEAHIPGAAFFDIDVVKGDSPYPHMLPTSDDFARAMRSLGIRRSDTVVVYDTRELGIFSAPRTAWMFYKVFGHDRTHVLDNFKAWVDQGLPTESGPPPSSSSSSSLEGSVDQSDYPVPSLDEIRVVAFPEMREIALDHCRAAEVIDARPHGRWLGRDPEPRPGLPSGHMPGSFSVPFSDVLDPETKTMLSPDELRQCFKAKGISGDRPAIVSCGTGVTAAVVDLALQEAFGERPSHDRRLYDGSWTEWAQRVTAEEGLIEKSDVV